ncbi:hypothetical protein OG875_10320 [Streptomyces sp. NBC_01498]|uniref:hypothetical protein n=1 Tax=Streptomyces sp. NBC_01498 TaxID=2975870 RepID=UPI002E7BA4A7|nr:hypothetical protein [Streptomyces sp. NBC_01498]WTL24959.1 hypothetical protein OG875_10320 [Streptomyces sp. NBC_01498]
MGAVVRRPVAGVAALVLLVEAVGFVFLNGVMATVVDNQQMSLAGLHPDAMSTGAWAAGAALGLFLALCALPPARAALTDRGFGRVARPVLVVCAILHAVLGALAVGLVGWTAFLYLMVVLGLIVLTLVAYEGRPAPGAVTAPTGTDPTAV